MRTAYISISYDCNEKCIFCPCSEPGNQVADLTLDELKRCVDEAVANSGVRNVLLSGGEPTIARDFLPFLEYIRSKNLHISILSNSLKFASRNFLQKVIDITGTEHIEITTAIHSHLPEKHNRLTQMPNSFQKSLEGLDNIIDAGIRTLVKYNIIRYTYNELPEYTDWFYQRFPDQVAFLICNIDINGIALKNKDLIGVTFEESTPFLEKALDKVIEYRRQGRKRNVKVFTTPLCTIDPYYWGFVNNETKDNLAALRVPAEETTNDRLFLEISSDSGPLFAPCLDCALKDPCPGTWRKTGELYGDSVFKPVYATE
jgi:MoaA/NifB/PqqE/SkfB family radical SAM enzyme